VAADRWRVFIDSVSLTALLIIRFATGLAARNLPEFSTVKDH
jgi:hypothetical protein